MDGLSLATAITLALWLVAALVTPALERRWNWPGLRGGLTATVLMQALTALLSLAADWPLVSVGWTLLGVLGGGWLAECLGVRTGLPFGAYAYTARLQPQLGGVPLLVTVAYAAILIPAWGTADVLVGGSRGWEFIVVSAVAATAWDLFLDPQLVSWRVWEWRKPGGYFGIPWVNFVGWLSVTAALTTLLQPAPFADPRPLATIYSLSWVMELLGLGLVWRRRGPAVVGGVVMGSLVAAAWWRLLQ